MIKKEKKLSVGLFLLLSSILAACSRNSPPSEHAAKAPLQTESELEGVWIDADSASTAIPTFSFSGNHFQYHPLSIDDPSRFAVERYDGTFQIANGELALTFEKGSCPTHERGDVVRFILSKLKKTNEGTLQSFELSGGLVVPFSYPPVHKPYHLGCLYPNHFVPRGMEDLPVKFDE